jgi:hypothetical protein
MLTEEMLQRLKDQCDQELKTPPDIAEYLEERADDLTLRAEVLSTEPANREPVANDGPMQLLRPVWTIDRLAQVLNLTLVEEPLPRLVLGAFVRAQQLVIVQPDLRPDVRTVVVPHECGHGALHPRAPHAEVWYLGLAMLLPRRLLERLPPGRAPTAAALAQLVPYRVAAWAAETRSRILTRAARAIAL